MHKKRSAFTLIELMLVVAIMAILATAVVSGVRSISRQARSAKCQAQMRNLHQGVMNYFADTGTYPFAGSHEFRKAVYPPRYILHTGWVSWLRGKGSEDQDNPEDQDDRGYKVSQAKHFKYVGCGVDDDEDDVRESVRLGSIFPYVRKDYSIYCCGDFLGKKLAAKGRRIYRTYAMNSFFGSRTNPREAAVKPKDLSGKEASRLALFVELDGSSGAAKTPGFSWGAGDPYPKTSLPDDPSWDWEDSDGRNYGESYGCWHKKGKDLYGHVVFLDGHVETVLGNSRTAEKSEMLGRGDKKE